MTPEQRYLFDVSGYLHLKNVLTTEEVASARDAAERYMNSSPGDLESGFTINGKSHQHGFAFDKALEALVFHPSTWSIVKELTNNKPQLALGTMLVDHSEIADSQEAQRLHCAREDLVGKAHVMKCAMDEFIVTISWCFRIWRMSIGGMVVWLLCRDRIKHLSQGRNTYLMVAR